MYALNTCLHSNTHTHTLTAAAASWAANSSSSLSTDRSVTFLLKITPSFVCRPLQAYTTTYTDRAFKNKSDVFAEDHRAIACHIQALRQTHTQTHTHNYTHTHIQTHIYTGTHKNANTHTHMSKLTHVDKAEPRPYMPSASFVAEMMPDKMTAHASSMPPDPMSVLRSFDITGLTCMYVVCGWHDVCVCGVCVHLCVCAHMCVCMLKSLFLAK